MKKVLLFLCCLLLCLTGSALASVTLPDGMEVIEEESFAEVENLGVLIVPDTVKTIEARAFADSGLTEITLPASLESIAEDAFDGLTDVIVHAEGEVAKAFVSAHPEHFRPTYRALIIGQTYPDTAYELTGPANDAKAMRSMLSLMSATPYITTVKSNLTRSGILSAIRSAFADAAECDVSLLYYSGHGLSSGNLVGTDLGEVTPAQLRSALDEIPGQKIIIVDCCYSGGMIARSAVSLQSDDPEETAVSNSAETDYSSEAASFVSGFTSAFRSRARSAGTLDDPPYMVLTACAGSELSWESADGYGYFTNALTEGCGWDELLKRATGSFPADSNGDGSFTLSEVYSYAAADISSRKYGGGNYVQTVQVYPSSCSFVLFAK